MDIVFTTVGLILVVAIWPALLLYAWNDPMLRNPRGSRSSRRARRTRQTRPGRPPRVPDRRHAPSLLGRAPGTP